MSTKDLRTRKICTVTAVSLLTMLYIVIFCFSAESGEESSAVSSAVTRALLKGYYGFMTGSLEIIADMVYRAEGIVRKLAHFLEYMSVGFLSCSLVVMWYRPLWKGGLFVVAQVIISAALDEFHQYFVPGRYASVKDVMIDTAGGITGVMLMLLLWKCIRIIRRKGMGQ